METEEIKKCRICGSENLSLVIDLGEQPLSTLVVTEENKDRIPTNKVPLKVVRCSNTADGTSCGLVQLSHTYPSNDIYREYWYRSGVNQTMRDALQDISDSAVKFVPLDKGDVVIDIGCNDGTLLNSYSDDSTVKYGFDPTENIRGDIENFKRVVGFFSAEKYFESEINNKAKIITSIAMFYDLDDPNKFVSDIKQVLHDDGVWVVQMADLPEMLEKAMFDQIIHEHLEYYHYAPFEYLLSLHNLKVVDVEKNNINGSSYRFYIKHADAVYSNADADKRIDMMKQDEAKMMLDTDEPYKKFREASEKVRDDLIEFVSNAKKSGKKVYGYGASTKGNVILNYCGFGPKDIPAIADRNERKDGSLTIGTYIPIIMEEKVRELKPDYLLVLPYYFMDEMLVREKDFIGAGGKFVIPIPTVHVVP